MALPTSTTRADVRKQSAEGDLVHGWREEFVQTPDGKSERVLIPLTTEEVLHPEEEFVMPERTEHDYISDDLCDMLRAYFADQPGMAVFRNLKFEWDHPKVKPYALDVAVVPNVHEPGVNRSQFVVATEGTRPCVIIEIVSVDSRQGDRVTKVKDYARVGVTEYVYIDARTRKGKTLWEIAGFRLDEEQYLPILPDEDDALYCATVDLRIGIDEGQVWLEDPKTGKNLLTNLQAQRALREAEARADAETEARRAAEARIAELEAQLRTFREGRQE
ncbi:MAG: Uma2 family endonuclease [Caldilineaceae bacterium]